MAPDESLGAKFLVIRSFENDTASATAPPVDRDVPHKPVAFTIGNISFQRVSETDITSGNFNLGLSHPKLNNQDS